MRTAMQHYNCWSFKILPTLAKSVSQSCHFKSHMHKNRIWWIGVYSRLHTAQWKVSCVVNRKVSSFISLTIHGKSQWEPLARIEAGETKRVTFRSSVTQSRRVLTKEQISLRRRSEKVLSYCSQSHYEIKKKIAAKQAGNTMTPDERANEKKGESGR